MAQIVINDVNINYSKSGNTGLPVILLHGWGQDLAMMSPIEQHLAAGFQVYNIDLPGFGLSEEPKYGWSVYDYADCLRVFIEQLKLIDPIIIAHSFGARLAIIYASLYKVHKMVITGGAGIKDKRGIDYYLRVYSYKLAKKSLGILGLKQKQAALSKSAGSSDYQKTNGVMREAFVKIVNEDLSNLLSKIEAEVLLVWGENDEATPLWMGKKMEQSIPNAGLAIFDGDDHFAYYHQMPRFLKVIDIFLKQDRMV